MVRTQPRPDAEPSAEALLRAAYTRIGDRAAWRPRLRLLIDTDRRRHRAAVAVAGLATLLTLCLAPLALAAFSGVPLAPAAARALVLGALTALLPLPAALVWRGLARHRHHRLLVALHDLGASMTRDADGWVLRDRSTQQILAVRARDTAGGRRPRGSATA